VIAMLIQFNFKNFKSFRDDTTLDLSATKITEHAIHVREVGAEKILPVSAIYGANGSGKSNVYQAFKYMSDYVLNSFQYGGDTDSKRISDSGFMKPTPFLFDTASRDDESSFEVYFVDTTDPKLIFYNYGFCANSEGVTEEWLNSKAKSAREYKSVFYRSKEENTLDLSGLPSKSRENIEISLEKEALVVSLGAKLRIPKLKFVRDWFSKSEMMNFGSTVETFFLSRLLPIDFIENEKVRENVLRYFSSFDPSIQGFVVEPLSKEGDPGEKYVRIDSIHTVIGSSEIATIPLRAESDGTLKMFALYPALQTTLKNGSVLFVDELNARLHPLLVRSFVQTFLNPELNPRKAQLIFTTHDAWQLSNELLRRDEVWFTDKASTGVTSLYSLADFLDEDGAKIRKDESYEKNYLLGKYGAIPDLNRIKVFEENIDYGER
jgi:AAA15 family ATPase/GTPase